MWGPFCDDEFNVIAKCECCGEHKENCTEDITTIDGKAKVVLICKECYEKRK